MKTGDKESVPGPLSAARIKEYARNLGADTVGIAKVGPVQNEQRFREWLANGYAGEMDYLKGHADERFHPDRMIDGAKAIIVVGVNYCPADDERERRDGPYKVARYAWGEDYHRVLRRLLRRLRSRLKKERVDLAGRICVDTAPFMDKYWAERAGLGWQGKHTNLVSRQYGSWLVIGSLIINADVDEYDEPHRDHCGKCTKCIDACPTGAIVRPYLLDATRCISYWTIEAAGKSIPDDIRDRLDGNVFGCDICLTVCPFNRFSRPRTEAAFGRRDDIGLIESGRVASIGEKEFDDKFGRSAVNRPRLDGLKRNIENASGE